MTTLNHIICGIAVITAMLGLEGCAEKETGGTPDVKPYLKLSTNEKIVNNKNGVFEIDVTSNLEWTAVPQVEWISVTPAAGKGSQTVRISYESNQSETSDVVERRGSVRFTADGIIPVSITIVQGARTFKNPVFMPMPDPYIWREPSGSSAVYYPCKSSGSGVNLGKTYNLTAWGATRTVWSCRSFNYSDPDATWNAANLWAPELFRIDGVWYVYYAAGWPSDYAQSNGYGQYGSQRTGVLRNTSDDPTSGVWEDMGQIFTGEAEDLEHYLADGKVTTENNIYAIDMTVFELDDKLYAVWSGNESKSSGNQRLYIAPMENPWTIKQSRIRIAYPSASWELNNSNLLEGPAMLFNPDKTKLFCVYSCNGSRTTDYKLGWLELDLTDPATSDPLVPQNWKKSSNYVFWRYDGNSKSENPYVNEPQKEEGMKYGGVNGVGHNTFTKSPDGTEDWIVYHTKRYKDSGWDNRDCFIQKFTWDEEGRPVFGKPVGWQEEIEVPSGEPSN